MEAATTAFLAVVVVGVAAGSAVTTVDHAAHSSLPSPCRFTVVEMDRLQLQPADIGWPTGNGNKLGSSQAQLGQATSLVVA